MVSTGVFVSAGTQWHQFYNRVRTFPVTRSPLPAPLETLVAVDHRRSTFQNVNVKKETTGKKEKGNENGRTVTGAVHGTPVLRVSWSSPRRERIPTFGNRDGFGDWDMGTE